MKKLFLIITLLFLTACAGFEQYAKEKQLGQAYEYRSYKGYSDMMAAKLYCEGRALERMKEKNAVYESTRVALTLDCMKMLGWLR